MPLKTVILSLSFMIGFTAMSQDVPVPDKAFQKEVAKLIGGKPIQQAFFVIDALEVSTHKNLIDLTEIPAPPFNESARAEAFKSLLEAVGADSVWIDAVGNVLALLKGTSRDRVVALDAHLDTVFPEETDVKVKLRGDTLFAPGIGDDSRGLAMIITIMKAIKGANIKTKSDILFIGTVGEEGLGDLRGVKHLFGEGNQHIDAWISIDGGSVGRINHAALGSVRYKAVFKGKGGHSWGAFGLANPHHALGFAIKHFTEAASKYTAQGPKTSFNVGRIGGGTSVNSIPFESWMEVDMRSVSDSRLKEIDAIFKKSMQEAVATYNGTGVRDAVTLELIKIGDRPSGETPVQSPMIQRAIAINDAFEVPSRLTIGSTNANIPISQGIAAVTIGRGGDGGGAHSLGEWWRNEDGAKAIKMALVFTLVEAGYVKSK